MSSEFSISGLSNSPLLQPQDAHCTASDPWLSSWFLRHSHRKRWQWDKSPSLPGEPWTPLSLSCDLHVVTRPALLGQCPEQPNDLSPNYSFIFSKTDSVHRSSQTYTFTLIKLGKRYLYSPYSQDKPTLSPTLAPILHQPQVSCSFFRRHRPPGVPL